LLESESEYIQGYFFSKPLLPVDFEERLNARFLEGMKKASSEIKFIGHTLVEP